MPQNFENLYSCIWHYNIWNKKRKKNEQKEIQNLKLIINSVFFFNLYFCHGLYSQDFLCQTIPWMLHWNEHKCFKENIMERISILAWSNIPKYGTYAVGLSVIFMHKETFLLCGLHNIGTLLCHCMSPEGKLVHSYGNILISTVV